MIPQLSTYLGKVSRSERRDMGPLTLYKRANLILDTLTQEILVSPLYHARTGIPLDSRSVCQLDRFVSLFHNGNPTGRCSCGFHAFNSEDKCDEFYDMGQYTIVIEASGVLQRYENGYRYGHQRVKEIKVGNCSSWCGEPANRIVVTDMLTAADNKQYLFPACKKHLRLTKDDRYLSISEFQQIVAKQNLPDGPAIKVTASKFTPQWKRSAANQISALVRSH